MSDGYLRIGEFGERVGVSPDRLRAWERRYGLLGPDRSVGGFRLYSDEDVARVERMTDLLAAGLSASEAARLAIAGTAPGGVPAPAVATDRLQVATDRPPPGLDAGRLTAALDGFDEAGAHRALDELLASFDVETVLRDVVLPYLARLGDRWAAGEVTVGQEHFASNLLRGRLLALARGWGLGAGPSALLSTPSGEEHDLALIVCGLALWRRGWRITFLGADTPIATVGETVDTLRPDLLLLSAVEPQPLVAAADDVAAFAARLPVAIGGAGATAELATRVGAIHLDADPVTAADRLTASRR